MIEGETLDMTFISVILILLSSFFHAWWNYYSKASRSTQLFFFWTGAFTAGVAIVAFMIKPLIVPRSVWSYIIASGLVHWAYWFSLSRAYTLGEISYVYPISRSAPGFIPLFALLFLRETISARGLVGILCIVFSIYLLQQRGNGMALRELIRYMRQPDAVWAFLTLGTVIAYSLIDKGGMSEFHAHSTQSPVWRAITYYLVEGVIAFVFYGGYIIFRFPRKEITDIGRLEWKPIIATGALAMISYTLILYVMMTEKVSYVVALRQCSVIFAVLFGAYVMKESHAKLRLTAAVVMVIGMILTSTA